MTVDDALHDDAQRSETRCGCGCCDQCRVAVLAGEVRMLREKQYARLSAGASLKDAMYMHAASRGYLAPVERALCDEIVKLNAASAQLIKNLEHERAQKHAAQVALTQLREAAERTLTTVAQYLPKAYVSGQASVGLFGLGLADAELRAALDSTKPESEPEQPTPATYYQAEPVNDLVSEIEAHLERWEFPSIYECVDALARAEAPARRDTFDAGQVRELCDYIDEYKHCHGYLMGMVKAVRESEVKP